MTGKPEEKALSYCRWSSDDFGCDLYCYRSAEGWATHVSSFRIAEDLQPLPAWPGSRDPDGNSMREWLDAHRERGDIVRGSKREPIGLAFDGASFTDGTIGEFRTRLVGLRDAGYRFPDHVLETVDAEMADDTCVEPVP